MGETAAPAIVVVGGQEAVGDAEVCLVNCKVLKHMKQSRDVNFVQK